MRLAARGAGRSDTGRVREVNEDRILLLQDLRRGEALFAVADGLGGHPRGDIASALAIETLRIEVPALLAQGLAPQEVLLQALRHANTAILAKARADDVVGMATTCTAVLVDGGEGLVAHVGDSRAYLLRGPAVRQLTTDHSLASELARHGSPVEAGIDGHAQRHVLTRALGSAEDVEVDLVAVPLRSGDVLALMSDGLYTAVPDPEIAAVVRGASDPDDACRTLVGLANARGGFDNASVIVVHLTPRWAGRALRLLAPVVVAVMLAAGVGVYRLEHAYFLGVSGDRIAVMRGTPIRVLGVPLAEVVRETQVTVTQIAPAHRTRIVQGIPAGSAEEAESVLHDLLSHP
jgi:serine/threonine protein phosphatase PrpC